MTEEEKGKISKLRLALIGRPGSGKGTQVELIQKEFGLILIPSPGNIYRDPEFRKTKWGKIAGPLVDAGKFVPDEITNSLMREKIFELTANNKKGFVSEGYPRTLGQAKFADKEINLDWLINLNVSEEIIIKRLSNRRVCPKCGFNYNLITIPPKKDEICNSCQLPLIQREDDKLESIKTRLKMYHQTAEPTIEYYRQKGKLIEVDGDQPVEKVFKDIVEALSRKVTKY